MILPCNTGKVHTPRKIKIIPVIIMILLVVFIIGGNLCMIKLSINEYVLNQRLREGHSEAEKVASTIKMVDYNDRDSLDSLYSVLTNLNEGLVGLEIRDQDGNVLFKAGNEFPKDNYTINYRDYSFIETVGDVYLSTTGNNALYKGINQNFDIEFAGEPIKGQLGNYWSQRKRLNQVQGYQELWYEEDLGEVKIITGHIVELTDYDYQVCFITAFSMHATGFVVALVLLFFIIRVIKSQNRLIAAYYADRETGGRNWYYFVAYVNKKLKYLRARRNKDEKKAVIQLRMEKFHNFISCYGEDEGAILIKEIYERIVNLLPKGAVVARYDMSDFAIFLEESDEREVEKIMNRTIEVLQTTRQKTSLMFTAGVCMLISTEKVDASEAYTRAAIARQKASESFQDKIVFFNSKMQEEVLWERKMENDLAAGIANKEFEVYLQPKYSCTDEKMAAAEALVRWNHPTEGFLTPYKFIPIFEKTGLITKLDDYMISNVARIQSEYLAEGKQCVPISVNISRIHFARTDLAEHIGALVDEYHVPHNLIEIELTESAFFDDKDVIVDTANRLRELGFEVSLDDFGSGYSSLNSLRNLPIDIVKLDSGFFRGEDVDGKGDTIVREVISLAKQLDIKVVAEGIEVREQVDSLAEAGCDLIQGYYFAKPMPLDDFKKLI